jgi:Sap, sulfolipid-1-addressing protein
MSDFARVMLQVLPQALFLALSPLVIAIVILLLTTKKPIRNALAFTLPSFLGSMVVGIVLILVLYSKNYQPKSTASDLTYWAQILTAVIFFAIAFLCWWKLPKGSDSMKMPKWVTYIDRMEPRTALIYGAILFLNNVFFTFTAVTIVLQGQLSASEGVKIIVYFTLIATVGMWAPIAYKLVAPESSPPNIERARLWFIKHNRIILILEFGIVGLLVLIEGVVGLVR